MISPLEYRHEAAVPMVFDETVWGGIWAGDKQNGSGDAGAVLLVAELRV